jgi:hypothetical protein
MEEIGLMEETPFRGLVYYRLDGNGRTTRIRVTCLMLYISPTRLIE